MTKWEAFERFHKENTLWNSYDSCKTFFSSSFTLRAVNSVREAEQQHFLASWNLSSLNLLSDTVENLRVNCFILKPQWFILDCIFILLSLLKAVGRKVDIKKSVAVHSNLSQSFLLFQNIEQGFTMKWIQDKGHLENDGRGVNPICRHGKRLDTVGLCQNTLRGRRGRSLLLFGFLWQLQSCM